MDEGTTAREARAAAKAELREAGDAIEKLAAIRERARRVLPVRSVR